VRTVQIKAGQVKLAAAGPSQPAPPVTSAIPARTEVPETSNALVAKAENGKADVARADLPPQPAGHGTGNGILGVLPASSLSAPSPSQALAYADPSPHASSSPTKPEVTHTGWIIQVGALESESEALQRIEAARNQAHGLLNKADPFTEPVVAKGDRKLYRARFAGLDRDQAEAVCRTLKRSDISCITMHN
ncbi:MAG: SPOR domain-containing protein, partial [Bradyrhizobium sp.]